MEQRQDGAMLPLLPLSLSAKCRCGGPPSRRRLVERGSPSERTGPGLLGNGVRVRLPRWVLGGGTGMSGSTMMPGRRTTAMAQSPGPSSSYSATWSVQSEHCTCILVNTMIDGLLFFGMINMASSRISLPCHAEEERDHCPASRAGEGACSGCWRGSQRGEADHCCKEPEPGNLATKSNLGRRGEADRCDEEKQIAAAGAARSWAREVWSPAPAAVDQSRGREVWSPAPAAVDQSRGREVWSPA